MVLMLPEIIVIATAFAVLLLDLFLEESQRKWLAPMTLVGLALAVLFVIRLMPEQGVLLGGRFGVDSLSGWFKLFFLISALITVALSLDLLDGRVKAKLPVSSFRGEYYTILLFTVSGMMFLVSARDLVTLYLSLELSTIPLFVLGAWRRDRLAGEGGLKYVILGVLASALLLYGLGFFYGLTGTMDLQSIGRALKASPLFWFAAALVTAGVGFKLTLVPFHMWAADVYQGAPTPITAYLSVASKGAGLVLMFQLFFRAMGSHLGEITLPLAILATITMTLGNAVALVERNIKRLMAFSAVSQAGYLILGFIGPAAEGIPAMIFYLGVYLFTNLAVFAVIIFYGNETGAEEIKDYRGLARTNPLIALAMMIGLFGLAGIPPLAGFVGKFFLFSIAAKAGLHWLVAVAALNSTVSLYYYLRIVRQMYIEPKLVSSPRLSITPVLGATLGITAVGSVVLGIVPFFYEIIHTQTVHWLAGLF